MKFRYVYFVLGVVLIVLLNLLTEPSTGLIKDLAFGGPTVTYAIYLLNSVLYVGLLHIGMKASWDYIDYPSLIKKSCESSTGAGLVLVCLGLYANAIAQVIKASVGG